MNKVQKALQQRYAHLHPVLFQRSLEKARTDVELFDILDKITEYPVMWDEDCRAWTKTDLLHIPIRR